MTKKQDTAVTASLEMVEGGPAMCLDPIIDIHQPSRDEQSPNNSEDESTDQYGDEVQYGNMFSRPNKHNKGNLFLIYILFISYM